MNKCIKTYLMVDLLLENPWLQRALLFAIVFFMADPCLAGVEGDMQESVRGLQREIFGSGWVTVGKIAATATGIVMTIARSSFVPLAIGGLSSGGIHFFQKYTEAAAGCLL